MEYFNRSWNVKYWKSTNIVLLSLIIFKFSPCWTASSPGAASSVFSSRGGGKQMQRPSDSQNRENNYYSDDMYEMTLNTNETFGVIPDEQLLIARLLRNYDPAARPVYNASNPVVVKFGFLLVQICDMDERNQILTTNVWLEQEWFDERLKWNQSEYNNLDKIRLPCNRIWLPDIVLYNSADDYTEGYMQSKAMVKPNGEVFWPPPAKLRSSCKIDVTFFPFDDQVCHIKFGSWTYSGLQVDLVNKSHTTDLTNYIKSGEWELKYVIVERNVQFYPCCPDEPYPDVIFYIHIRRRILYYLFNIILPCVWLSVLSLVGFWLPPDSGEKITLGITVLLAFSVFMLLIAENIPATSEMVPLIGIYLTVTMSMTSLSIILTVLVLQLHHAGQFSPIISRKIYNFMTRKVAFFICMSSTVKRYETNNEENLKKFKANSNLKTHLKENGLVLDDSKSNSIKSVLLNCDKDLSLLKENLSSKSKSKKHSNINYFFCCCCQSESSMRICNKNGFDKEEEKHEPGEYSQILKNQNTMPNAHGLGYNDNNEPNDSQHVNAKYNYNKSSKSLNPQRIETNKPHFVNCEMTNTFDSNNHINQTPARVFKMTKAPSMCSPSRMAFLVANEHVANSSPSISNNLNCKCNNCANNFTSLLQQQNESASIVNKKELIDSLEIFSKNLKEYLAKQEKDTYRANVQNEWKLVALIVDRILFWIFTALTIVSSIILLIIVPILKNKDLIKTNTEPNFQN